MIDFKLYRSIEINSKDCINGSIFLAIKDRYINNTTYIEDAIKKGASIIVTNVKNTKYTYIKNYKVFLKAALNYFYPLQLLKIIGITGTDGKTSTATIISELINQKDSCGYIGTNGITYHSESVAIKNTTPDCITMHKTLFQMQKEGIKYVTIECSSEGIIQDRLINIMFDVIVFTNLSEEHLNTHKNMKNYLNAKLKIRKQLRLNGVLIVNNDDLYFKCIKGSNVLRYGLSKSNCYAKNIKIEFRATNFDCILDKQIFNVSIPYFGEYNVYNTLAAILVLKQFNLFNDINYLSLSQIKGRFEYIEKNNKVAIIDFAHTPNALKNLLLNIKKVTDKEIILVFGSRGGKGAKKRVSLGSVANKYADKLILTSEDPKGEQLLGIFSDLTTKIKKDYYLVVFRKDAIKLGCSLLDENSILVIIGKGLEQTEEFSNFKLEHNDYLITKDLLNA